MNVGKRGDVAVQIQQRVHLDCGFVLSEFGPGKQRETQVDGGRVQRVQALLQLHSDRIIYIKRSREADHRPDNLCLRESPYHLNYTSLALPPWPSFGRIQRYLEGFAGLG